MSGPGLSRRGIDRMHHVLSGYVERSELPGLVALVSQGGDLHVETLGRMAVGESPPMARDAIFRIASLAKPITAVAAMILLEECKIRLDDSIEPWLPELANRRVLRTIASEPDDTVPARRAITVRDLLTYRMGFGAVMAMPGTYPIQDLMRESRLGGDGPPRPTDFLATDEWIRTLGTMPWMAHPGERFLYHTSGDVLGVLISRVASQPLSAFLRDRVFEPLGMKDTGFHVPQEKLERLPGCYLSNRRTGNLDLFDAAASSAWTAEPRFESGGGGLVSTVDDCFAFNRMLLDKGRVGGERLLSRASVELMTSDQLMPEQRVGAEVFFGDFRSWGFGMSVDIRRDELFHVPGRFGWDGGFGTSAYADPTNGSIGILMTQRMMDSPIAPKVFTDFWTLAYAAMG